MEKKTFDAVCPKCGSDNYDTYDYDWEGDYVGLRCICDKCNEVWTDWYKLKYAGYSCNGKVYDTAGDEVKIDNLA